MFRRYGLAIILAGALLCGAGPLNAGAQSGDAVKLPETPAARRVEAFIKAFNTGDPKVMRDFHQNNAAEAALPNLNLDEIEEQDREAISNFGKLTVRRVVESSPNEITVLLQAERGQWLRIRLRVEDQPPHKIIGLGFEQAEAPPGGTASAAPAAQPGNDAERVAALEAFINEQVQKDEFSGAVLITKDGKPLFARAYGLASRAWNAPNRLDTKFNLGSMNKMVTAIAIAQLVEQGKVAFEDPIGKHLPDFPNPDAAKKVTLHHLLTHTSGMGDYFNEKYVESAKERFRTVQDFLKLFADQPLRFEPGTQWAYSNGGFMVLGAVIEKVTGQSYFDYVREHIYKPAGMTNTDAYEMDMDTPNLAIGYTRMSPTGRRSEGPRRNNLYLHVVKGGPAGGGFSTVEDLVKFADALRNNRLVGAKIRDIVWQPHAAMGRTQGMQYGYGFMVRTVNGQRIVGHGGGFPGINGMLDIYLDSGYTVAVLSNYDPPAAQRVADRFQQLLLPQADQAKTK